MNRGSMSVVVLGCVLLSMSGCVMREQYEAEKSRALNFQRLLAQEEKRTGELDAEVKRLKRDVPELEARNRELTAQVQAVREQLGRVQEENAALREAAALKAREELDRVPQSKKAPRPKPAVKAAPPKPDIEQPIEKPLMEAAPEAKTDLGEAVYHQVRPGDTLFRVARQYNVSMDQIKDWNHLRHDTIEVGQKLIVGYR